MEIDFSFQVFVLTDKMDKNPYIFQGSLTCRYGNLQKVLPESTTGPVRESNPGPLAP